MFSLEKRSFENDRVRGLKRGKMETLIIVVVILLFLAAFMLIRTARVMRPLPFVEAGEMVEVNVEDAAKRLASVVQLETISKERGRDRTRTIYSVTCKTGRNVSIGA